MHTPDLKRRKALSAAAALLLASASPALLHAQAAYPSKPIRLVVPFPPGQGADTSARTLAQAIERVSGASVLVDNRPGGNNSIGVRAVTSAPADGYTLLYGTNSPLAANVAFFRDLGYDPVKDLTPVAQLGRSPWVVVVSAAAPYQSYQELVQASQRDPQAISFGAGATGYQLAATLLIETSGLQAMIVPYKGSPQAVQDVIGQQVTATMSDFGTMLPLIQSGRVRPLLVYDKQRIAAVPDVPSLPDVGIDAPALFSWTALFAPAGTPAGIVDWLSATVERALQEPGYRAYVARNNSEIAYAGAQALAAFQQQEIENYRHAMRIGNVQPQ